MASVSRDDAAMETQSVMIPVMFFCLVCSPVSADSLNSLAFPLGQLTKQVITLIFLEFTLFVYLNYWARLFSICLFVEPSNATYIKTHPVCACGDGNVFADISMKSSLKCLFSVCTHLSKQVLLLELNSNLLVTHLGDDGQYNADIHKLTI